MKSLIALILSALVGAAVAQDVPSTPALGSNGDVAVLDTVVVTAQKRRQPALDVPISMTVLDQDDLEKARVGSLEDLQRLVPGFSMENQAGYNVLTMRGVGGGGRNIGFDPRAGVYLDGIYMGQAQALRQPLFDVEQVEVLRGPQGHLFGRNAVAGAVNITTGAPTREFESVLRGVVGSQGTHEAYATVSGPVSEAVLGKISLASETHGGFTTNLYDGQKLDDLGRITARGQIFLLPSDRLNIRISADASTTKQKATQGEPVTDLFEQPLPGGILPKRTVNFNTTPFETVKLSGGSVRADYTLDSHQILTALFGYRQTHQDLQLDNDYSPKDLLRISYGDDFKQSSEEIRIASPNLGSARYVLGLYHLNETARTDRKATIGLDVGTSLVNYPLIPFLVPLADVTGTVPGAVVSNNGVVRTDTYALFGAVDYDITHWLTLNLGARFTHETKDVLFNLDGAASGSFGIGSLTGYQDSRSENKLSPTVGATYAVSKDQNVYAKFSRGFKSGGWNIEFLSSNGVKKPSFESETVDSYEVGAKGKLLGGRLHYDLAAYSSRFKDFQVFQFVDLGGGATSMELRNAADAESRGLDASLTLRATPQLDIGVKLGLVKAVFKSFNTCSPIVDCTGHRLPYAPNFTSSLTVKYGTRLPGIGGKLDFYGDYSFHGESFSDPVNDPLTQNIPGRELLNARLGYVPDKSHWDFSLWVHNLFDKDTVASRDRDFLGNLTVHRVDPRTAGLEGRYRFY
ncbi:MAG: TonB-dependent receptor [Rhodocyclaceae bacterium]|nr:TonB-dependent receptor [Rhodocyclaceae bacterium]